MTRVVLKFTEPAEASDRLPDSTFGEYNMLDERNMFSICDTVKLNSFAEFSFFWCVITSPPERIGAAGFAALHQ